MTRLRRVRRKTWLRGDFEWALKGNDITYVEGSWNSPLRWYGDVVGVGVDFATDLEWAGGTRMELVRLLRCVALRMELDHDHAPLLKLARAAVGIC